MGFIRAFTPIDDRLWARPAVVGEETIVLDVLSEAAAWLRGGGIDQWPARFPIESVITQIAASEVLVIEDDAAIVATLVVVDAEPGLWPDAPKGAAYVSRLAVARRAAGAELGRRVLDWVDEVVLARGGELVRLATSRDNLKLRRYYERLGFVHIGDPAQARWPTSLYERRASRRLDRSGTQCANPHSCRAPSPPLA